MEKYLNLRRPLSEKAFEEAKKYIPGGVDSPVRALQRVGETPLFIRRASGCTLEDIDGNHFTDLCLSWGVFILGHAHPEVNKAVHEAVDRGSSYGIPTLQETELAKMVNRAFPSMEQVRFVNSGTEATMSAIRLARGFTKRDVLVKFEGCYHGHADHLLVSAGSAVANISSSSSAGVPESFTRNTVCLPYNDIDSLTRYFAGHGKDVAAVIVEPVACNMGVVPPVDGFLQAIRSLTEQNGALLIFDEVITGFRLAFGGAQEIYDIHPDLTTVGKIVGGGFPAAAFGGRAEIMHLLAPDGPVYQAGTLSGNPVAMAAGLATTAILSHSGFYEKLDSRTDKFFESLSDIIKGHNIQLNKSKNMFTLFFTDHPVRNFNDTKKCDEKRFAKYFQNMLRRGIYVSPSQMEGNFLSIAHDDLTLNKILDAVKESID